ncbi:MAG: hypothetical protein Q6368_003045 [Candidatus Baldrarchaeota archaeon]
MRQPFLIAPSIGASKTCSAGADIPLVKARSFSITAGVKFHASATGNVVVKVYYSPDGRNWDTDYYATITLEVSAGNYIQKTRKIDVPEHGYLRVQVENEDTSYAATDLKVWYTIQSWEKEISVGDIRKDEGE